MAGFLQPLDQKFGITNPDGTPTDYFTRWAQQRMDDIVAAATADQVTAAIDTWAAARLINTASPLQGGGSLAADLNLSHAASGVTAGSYTNANIAVDADGHVTTAANGSGGGGGTVTTTGTPAAGNLTKFSGASSITNGDLSGDISTSGTLVTTIGAGKVTLAKMANVATGTVFYRKTAGTGVPQVQTLATLKTDLAITASDVSGLGYFATGTNAANLTGTIAAAQTPAYTGDVSSAAGSLTMTIGAHKVTRGMMVQTTAATILGSTAAGDVADLTPAQAKVVLAITAPDVSGLGYFATGTNAANLTGTLAVAQMPATTGGDVSNTAGTFTLSIGANKVTRAMLAQTAGATILGATAAGNVADLTNAQAKAFLAIVAADVGGLGYFAAGTDAANLTGTVPAAQLPAMTGGDVTSPAGSAVLTIGAGTVSLAKMANLVPNSIIGNNTGAGATPIALTAAQVKALLAIAAGDISGLGYFATGTGASNLTGTIGVAQLPTLGGGLFASGSTLYGAVNHPGYIAGNYYWTLHGITVSPGAAFTANNIKLLPFVLSKPITVAELAARVTTTSSGSSFQLALYANNATTGRPTGNALCSTGNLSTTTAAMVSGAAVSGLLNPGLYWMAVNQNNGVAAYLTTTSPVMGSLIGSATLANLNVSTTSNALCLTVSQAFGTWPDLTSASFTEQTGLTNAMVAMKAS